MKFKSGDLVFPGDFLAVSEQFLPGVGVFDDNGFIKSATPGNVIINHENKEISVVSKSTGPVLLEINDLVFGQVLDIRGQRALIDIQSKKDCNRSFALPYKAAIHVSQVKKGYLDRLSDAMRIGDIMVAKVIKVTGNNVDLSIIDSDLGIVKAMCTKCRNYLKQTEGNKLYCKNCDRKEIRKVASDYLDY